MIGVADIIQAYGASYRAKYGSGLIPSHQRALADIEQCRTEALGGHVYHCDGCDQACYRYHSCQNRHCPQCQHQAGQQWLERQQGLLLPVPYFMVTFTLPEPLRRLARSNQKVIYNLLFRASAAAVQELARDPRFVGGQVGLVGVLQTWARDLSYHPHIHYLVPGGGLSEDGQRWLRSRNAFLVHVKPLSRLFRAKFRAALQRTDLFAQVPAEVWRSEWVVHCQPVGNGLAALTYLAPYIFRVALSNNRIEKVAEGRVTFRYKAAKGGKAKRCTLPAEEFIRRFLQHVLPKSFVKVRYYGLFSPSHRARLAQAKALLGAIDTLSEPEGDRAAIEPGTAAAETIPTCPRCGQPLRWVESVPPRWARPP
ncbi:MAG: IS91 family transposase [Anaerolineales bacterium]|nr:IS91 family transposase [Anaerolineales bacterium]